MIRHLHILDKTFILSLFICMTALSACNESMQINSFAQSEQIRIQVGGSTQMSYNPLTCQIAFSRDLRQFRAHTDNMSDYFCINMSEIPVSIGQKINADIVGTTHRDVLSKKNLTFETVRLEGETIWLWSTSAKIGVCIQTIDLE